MRTLPPCVPVRGGPVSASIVQLLSLLTSKFLAFCPAVPALGSFFVPGDGRSAGWGGRAG
ncbi:hypothetical protein EAO72_22245 [Streptomyces sp. or43]|nr:hypothetical protein EAO72_22245 [Streptomyces sp. or43]